MKLPHFRAIGIAGRAFGLSAFAMVVVALGGTACGDDEGGVDAQIRSFCEGYFDSQSFACCSESDRGTGIFKARYRYSGVEDCVGQLSASLSESQGRRNFDSEAASSCLSHLGSRGCGAASTTAIRVAEESAGCGRVIGGSQALGQPCDAQQDCKKGLFCPPTKETGTSSCSSPAGSNESCFGDQAGSVDHPACAQNLICVFTEENPAGCPSPPCRQFKCVPFSEQGDVCEGLECGSGLACRDGICAAGGPGEAGAGCRTTDHCASGLFCDPSTAQCAPRKGAGSECRVGNNALLECKGICQGGDDLGKCSDFCSSG